MRTFARSLSIIAVLFASLTVVAHADTFSDFTITNGALTNGATYSGTFTYDLTNQWITNANITLTAGGITYNPSTFPVLSNGPNFIDLGGDNGAPYFQFYVTGTAPNLSICESGCGSGTFFFVNGSTFAYDTGVSATVTPALAPTPEPSSLILLGTGILGLAGAARRRFLNA